MISMSSSNYSSPPSALCDQILVDFPTRRRPVDLQSASASPLALLNVFEPTIISSKIHLC